MDLLRFFFVLFLFYMTTLLRCSTSVRVGKGGGMKRFLVVGMWCECKCCTCAYMRKVMCVCVCMCVRESGTVNNGERKTKTKSVLRRKVENERLYCYICLNSKLILFYRHCPFVKGVLFCIVLLSPFSSCF